MGNYIRSFPLGILLLNMIIVHAYMGLMALTKP